MKQTTLKSIFTLIGGLVFFTIFFTQCRKDKNIPFCEQYPDQCVSMHRIKDHYYFKTGSWWVYEEQNTGAIDSQWVSKSWSDGCKFDYSINNSQNNYENNYWTKLLTNGENCGVIKKNETGAFIIQNKTKQGDYVGELKISHFYYRENDSVYNYVPYAPNNYSRLIKIHKQFEVDNEIYNYVLEYYIESDPLEEFQSTKYFYAEHIGLIKKELIDSNMIWILLDYNIEQ